MNSEIKNKIFGSFSPDGREFIITDPATPAPWINYIWSGNYCCLVSHCGGGFSYYISPRDNRLTRFRYNSLPLDRPGRYIFIREHGTGERWSLTWSPTTKIKYDFYECRHGIGYTKISTEYRKIRSSITYFTPNGEDCEIWHVTLTNNSDSIRKLSIFSYVELCLGNALNDLINQPNDKHFSNVSFDKNIGSIFASRRYWVTNKGVSVAQPNQEWPYYLYFSSSLKTNSFDGSRDAFIGPWRSEENPIAIEKNICSNTEITYGDPCAALQSSVEIKPGEEIEFSVCMGLVKKSDKNTNQNINPNSKTYKKSKEIIEKYKSISNVKDSFVKVLNYWNNYISLNSVNTPDDQFNIYLNYWNKYQSAVTFDMARNAGYYHGGLLFGTGIRDQMQDGWGPLMTEPKKVRERIKEVLSYQFSDGSTLHNFFKVTKSGEKTGHSDTQLWIPFGILNYLKETGDLNFLQERVLFYDEWNTLSKTKQSKKCNNTIKDHLINALDYSISNLTKRHLPKFGPGDWNDTLDYVGRGGKGETIWGATFLCFILKESIELFQEIKNKSLIKKYRKYYDLIAGSVNKYAWDGEWYIRGFKDNGKPIGSHKCEEGKIFLEPQSWAILSGISDFSQKEKEGKRSESLTKSVEEYLLTSEAFQILAPAFRKVDDSIGLATRCVPGKKENAAVFNHPASWFVLAEIYSGRKDEAYKIYKNMFPVNRASDQERYKTEPYVYSEYITSREHSSVGEASHSWLTGTAVWMFRIGFDYILGVQPTYKGLKINPSIPSHWEKVEIKRFFRGATYNITILNPNKSYEKILEIYVDDKIHDSDILPLVKPGSHCNIKVILG
jgi:cellobiose phosphorylase